MAVHQQSKPDYSFLAAFDQRIARPKTSFLYLGCLALVTCAMLVLPLIYLAFVGALAWAVYYHAFHHWVLIMNLGGYGGGLFIMIFKCLIYLAPLFSGIVVVFFLFKPLLAPQPKRAQPLALNPSDNPLLYAFIAKISDAVGAPSPIRIDLNCDLNASAGFRRGFLSMMGSDLVLTIGLPLVANLSTREFAGVIAHEFGHFTQGTGMRLSYIIRSINFWFARVAYERDAWDAGLEQWSDEEQDWRMALVVWTAQIAVWFSRLVLKLLLFAGHIIGGFLLRQMEYDADAYAIKVAGSETFEGARRKRAILGAALELTYSLANATWRQKHQLPDNLSELLRQAHEQLPPAVIQEIDDNLGLQSTSLFDSHPSPADRIRRARLANEPGIFHDDRPASELFASFDHPARFVTLLHYTDDLGIPITEQMLIHVQSARQDSVRQNAHVARRASDEYFFGVLPLLVPLRLSTPVPSADYEAEAAELNRLAACLQQVAGQLAPIAAQYAETSKRLINARAAFRLLESGASIQPETFGLPDVTVESALDVEAEALATRDSLRHALQEVSTGLIRRLQLALALRLYECAGLGSDSSSPERVAELVSALNRASDEYANRDETLNSLAVLDLLDVVIESASDSPALSKARIAQEEVVTLSAAKSSVQPGKVATKGAHQLQLSKPASTPGGFEIQAVRQKANQWIEDYYSRIDELVELAKVAEGIRA